MFLFILLNNKKYEKAGDEVSLETTNSTKMSMKKVLAMHSKTYLATKLTVSGFVVANFPCFFEFGRLRIPKKFNEQYGPTIPNDIVLITENGDRWFCEYDHMSCRIIGALHSDVKNDEKHMVAFKVSRNDSIIEKKDGALFFFNVSWSDFSFFRLVIQSVHLNAEYDKVPICEDMYENFKNWNNGERITLWLLNKCWEVQIEWSDYYCMFGIGWSKFVKDADIGIGDTCIFECTGNRLKFNICIERGEVHDFIIGNPDLCWVKFFQIVFFQSLEQDRIVLPISLWDSLGKVLSASVEFVMPSNQTWSICYERDSSSFVFIKDFATFYELKEDFFVTFEYLGHSSFFVRIFDKSSLEISYFKLYKTSKGDTILLNSEYQFGFAKGNLVDVIYFRNSKGIVKDYVEMLDKFYDGSTLLSLSKRRRIFGRFVIILGCSSSNHKLHNVYIGNFVRSFSKDWTNGSISRHVNGRRVEDPVEAVPENADVAEKRS
ncbi:hypothetical protein POM88_039168 [Heracleum sosnowskyi]|uniref:TF-B3 domain-containing protein n=1 Tax=Heracleum sosnowskyi TaxID=360622 RepID=A0AAD8H9G4_9APIA|nr:hypothetical protein POM88_039168 [Heracleum sosnowskyi]